MMYSSLNPSVGFLCFDDELWTIAEGIDDLLVFLDCRPSVFAETYENSLIKLITQPELSLLPQPHMVHIYGVPCICSATRQHERWLVRLDRLPFGLEDKDEPFGLFLLAEGTKLKWANEDFFRLIGMSQEEFATQYSHDLSRFDSSLSSFTLRRYQYVAHSNLLFCASMTAGYCFTLPASSFFHTYQKALKANGMRVWQYDLSTCTLEGVRFNDTDLFQLETLHQRLRRGEGSCSSRFFLEGEKRYVSVQYQREGAIAFAVEQDISSYANKQRFTFFEEHLHERNLESLYSVIKADLTDNKVTYLKRKGLESRAIGEVRTFSDVLEDILQTLAFDEERQTFRKRFSHASLLEAQLRGIDELCMEYRNSDEAGSIHWVEARVLLNRDLNTHHIHALGTSRIITEKKKLELSLAENPRRDPITSFYDKETFDSMVALALKIEEDRFLSYALALIEVEGVSLINQTLFSHIAQIIRLGINDRCIVGRLDSTHFGLFFEKVESSMDVRMRLERLVSMLANASVFDAIEQHPSSYTGFVSGVFSDDSSYASLAEKAEIALASSHSRGKNQVCSYSLEDQNPFDQIMPLDLLDVRSQGVVLGCMDATIRSDDLGSTLPLILSQVGLYYRSSRVCMLSQESGKALQVVASWEPKASSRSFAALHTDPFAGLFSKQQVVRVFASEKHSAIPCLDDSDLLVGKLKVWNLEKCYLVVVDPASDDLPVLSHAVQLISSEMTKRRLLDRQEYLVYHDSDTGLRNFHGYNQFISTLQEDSMSSLGLVLVDINDLKDINKHHGKEYGNTLIKTVSQALRTCFPKSSLFRLSSHEFLGIRGDVTYKAFNSKVKKLSEQLETSHPRMAIIAQAWSDQEKHIPVLYNQASMELEAKKQNFLSISTLGEHYQAYEELHSSISRGEYLIYLQPKVWCKTGVACGAEALIRHMHPTHGVVSPAKFIPQLEQDGLIKYIDLFVFEEVCKLLRRWKEDLFAPMPISLNFSRLTLLDENLISMMEDFCASYDIDRRLVEVEITESFGALDRNLVQKVVEDIAKAGFVVCIDDFGSDYSNLSTLTSLPLKVLKLDKSLVDSLSYSPKAQTFVEGFITICKKLDIRTVAEGVETEAQKDLLTGMGCDMIQGYFYDKPLAIDSFQQKYSKTL